MTEHTLELATLKRDWVEESATQLALLLPQLGDFSTDELHPVLPKPDHNNWYGVLMAKLKNEGLIERVNAKPSNRPEANGRLISVWRAKYA